jgi:hypothetical protein
MNKSVYYFREYPFTPLFIGTASLLGGYFFYSTGAGWGVIAVFLVIGLGVILSASVLEVRADSPQRILSISRRGLFTRYHREIPFDDIETIRVDTSFDSDTRAFRIEIQLKDGSTVPVQAVYTGKRLAKEKRAAELREFIGISTQQPYRTLGGIPVSRWHSAEYHLPDHFLFLVQKTPDQPNLPDNRLMQTIYDKLFFQTMGYFGFDASELPNSKRANIVPLDVGLASYYLAYASDPNLIARVLTPWTAIPLENWAKTHPASSRSTSKRLAVLFAPTGLFLAISGNVNAENFSELTALGTEILRAQ